MVNQILISGASGLLGGALIAGLSESNDVLGLFFKNKIKYKRAKLCQCDITNKNELLQVLLNESFSPEVIIHCAAITDVDFCENNNQVCLETNVTGTKNLVEIALEKKSKFIYISSAAVYGDGNGDYRESDQLNPTNYYAKTKIESENIVRKLLEDYVIIRTDIIGRSKFQTRKKSLVDWILKEAQNNNEIKLFNDVFFNPISVDTLTRIIELMINKEAKGVFNLGSIGKISKLDMGRHVINSIKPDKKIIPISFDSLNFAAKRQKNSTLNVEKVQNELEFKLPQIQDELETIIKNI
jgi:dTDP-4-dehydrorhamnose reductase